MKRFKIIPVIDILNSKAVHAEKGERTKYKPLKSYLFQSSNPVEIISILSSKYNFDSFYIADLDSIMKKAPNFQILKNILKISNMQVMLDPGIVDLEDIFQFLKIKIKNLILGLETIKNFKIIIQCLQILNRNNLIVSIDMYNGQIISNAIDKSNKVFCVSGEGDIEVFINDIYKTVIGRDKRNYNFIKDNKRVVKEPKPEILKLLQEWHKGKLVLFSKGESRLKSMDELFSMLSMEIKLKRHNLVVIDNLMSLLTVSNSKDKNDAQGEFVQRCCDIAKAYNTHIIIVVQ